LTVTGMMMIGTFAYAASVFQGWVVLQTPSPAAQAGCLAITPVQALTPTVVTINVYNATDRDGLAASVANSLRSQGFKVADVANDPLHRTIAGVGEVRHGKRGAGGAALAALRLKGAKVLPDRRTDDTIDLVLGDTFTKLNAPPRTASANNVSTKAIQPSKAPSKAPGPTAAATGAPTRNSAPLSPC